MKKTLFMAILALGTFNSAFAQNKLQKWEKDQLKNAINFDRSSPVFFNCHHLVQTLGRQGYDKYIQIKLVDNENIEYRYHEDARKDNKYLVGPIERIRKAKVKELIPFGARREDNTLEKKIRRFVFVDLFTDKTAPQFIMLDYYQGRKWNAKVASSHSASAAAILGTLNSAETRELIASEKVTQEDVREFNERLNNTQIDVLSNLNVDCKHVTDVKNWDDLKFPSKVYIR